MRPKERYKKLKEHLLEENPVLVEAIKEYEELDGVAHEIGFIEKESTYTEEISWWPLISVLGTFSAGKSSFINEFLQTKLQSTGNQAVDDKFTVICYTKSPEPITLPGVALDADPRFPFYDISKEIEKIEDNETAVNRYLQLKGVNSERLKGKILIDSPGFDADVQRDETLKITKHIIDLSDLVLIFFDARHPEPGAMRDTLNHLVEVAQNHKDSDKILYILNQIDTCHKEDNLEDIIGAWQRALSQKGIVSGRFYAIYNESVSELKENEAGRLKKRKDADLSEIIQKIEKVSVDRAYRIVKNVGTKAKELLKDIRELKDMLQRYKKIMLFADALMLISLAAGGLWLNIAGLDSYFGVYAGVSIAVFLLLHFKLKRVVASTLANKIENPQVKRAFVKQSAWFRSTFGAPARVSQEKYVNRLKDLIEESKNFIQKLNDQFVTLKS